ncbi:MAG: extracellular solute-binding protein [Clostridia bacterium]|nr:extracellular solute-binding protein [Clostridia bacterium]MCL6522581.1 extracellular solute-binding protein [Bacillota bacterium]
MTVLPLLAALLLSAGCGGGSTGARATGAGATGAGGGATGASGGAGGVTLTIYAAGTLVRPFQEIDRAFEAAHPGVHVQAQFGGSVKEVKQVTELGQPADVVAVADYSVIPRLMFGQGGGKVFADWYVGFATNAITFVYTARSRGAERINASNWYEVLAEPGVQIGRSNPDTDPSGYQTLEMLQLASKYYGQPDLERKVLANAPMTNVRDTETELLSALEAGQIDYLAIYESDARQHGLKYVPLPPQINLSDARFARAYAAARVQTKSGLLTGKPIVYAVTIPTNAPHPELARQWVAFLLTEGRTVLARDGFGLPAKPMASDVGKVPEELRDDVEPWPAG